MSQELSEEEMEILIKAKRKEFRGFVTPDVARKMVLEDLKKKKKKKKKKEVKSMEKEQKVEIIEKKSNFKQESANWALSTQDEEEAIQFYECFARSN